MSGNAAGSADRSEQRHETEVKFRTDKSGLKAVLGSAHLKGAKARTVGLRSVYYDTPDWRLRDSRIVLRVRTKNGKTPTLDVKWAADPAHGMFRRGEEEVSCPDGEPDASLFEKDTARMLGDAIRGAALQPVFETRVRRRVVDIVHGASTIEIALDDGEIRADDKQRDLAEVEVEIKSGSDADLYDFAMALQRDLPLTLDFVSKSERGHRLVSGGMPSPVKASPVLFGARPSWDEAATAILSNTLSHFAANWAPLRNGDDPEAVHQLRVALRRMRSALSILNRTTPCEEIPPLREEAKAIATALGEARECDVFRENAAAGPLGEATGPDGDALLAHVERRRQGAYERARGIIAGPSASLFVLKLQSFLARKPWQHADEPAAAADLARAALETLHKKARKKGKHLPGISDEERHDLRIVLKNLRYASEFFSPLFGHAGRQHTFLSHVEALQELLGAHNDAVTTGRFLSTLDLASPDLKFAAGHVSGWYARAVTEADAHLMKAWKAFRKTKPFWE